MFAGAPHEDAMIALVTSLVVIIRLIEIILTQSLVQLLIIPTQDGENLNLGWLLVGLCHL